MQNEVIEKTWSDKKKEVLPELFRILREHDLTVSEAKSFLCEAQRLIDDRAKAV